MFVCLYRLQILLGWTHWRPIGIIYVIFVVNAFKLFFFFFIFFSFNEQQLGLYTDVGLEASFLWHTQKKRRNGKKNRQLSYFSFKMFYLNFMAQNHPCMSRTERLLPCCVALKVGLHRQFHTDCECWNLLGRLSRTMVRNTNVCPFGPYFEVKQILKQIHIWCIWGLSEGDVEKQGRYGFCAILKCFQWLHFCIILKSTCTFISHLHLKFYFHTL